MFIRRKSVFIVIAIIVLFSVFINIHKKGNRHFFRSEIFDAQTLRALGHSMYGAAEPGEILTVVANIRDGNEESWYSSWHTMGKKCEELALKAEDDLSKGNAFLRASNYYRASEFFINPSENERRLQIYTESVQAFNEALKYLKIDRETYLIPYENARMRAYYFPGAADKPLVLIHGGYDSTIEELFIIIGAALVARDYPVVIFEGPGQSNMIRKYNIKFTPAWHQSLSKTLDFVLKKDKTLEKKKKILIGVSLGGLLAGRAAAIEKRIDGLVIFGAPFDFQETAFSRQPLIGRLLFTSGFKGAFNLLAAIKSKADITTGWSLRNGMWTVGGETPFDFLEKAKNITLKDVSDKITCNVLLLYGEKDEIVPDAKIVLDTYKKSLVNAKSVTSVLFKEEDGSAQHCQLGSMEQAVEFFVTWSKSMESRTVIRDSARFSRAANERGATTSPSTR